MEARAVASRLARRQDRGGVRREGAAMGWRMVGMPVSGRGSAKTVLQYTPRRNKLGLLALMRRRASGVTMDDGQRESRLVRWQPACMAPRVWLRLCVCMQWARPGRSQPAV